MVAEEWLDHVPVPVAQVYMIPTELGARRAAATYTEKLRDVSDFDLVLLGLGEDRRTASLFPAMTSASNAPDVLAVFDAPKPPPLSAARLSRARAVLFSVEGESKRAGTLGRICRLARSSSSRASTYWSPPRS